MSCLKSALLLLATVLPGCVSVFAQSYPVQTITFSGTPDFSPAELLAASGLAAGASLDQAGMQGGAQRLSATGMFATVRFSFNGRELHYELSPASGLAEARFENFPWWEAKEISAQVSAKVPLYHGQLAPGSSTQEKIIAALTTMLAAQQVQGTVTASQASRAGAPLLTFRVTAPPVQIGPVTFTGATGDWVARLGAIGTAATGQDYSTLETPATLTQAVETIYREKGYLEVQVPAVTHQPPVVEGSAVRVPVAIAIQEGVQYRLGQFTVSGSVLMDQTEFLSKAILKPGEIVEQEKLHRTMLMLSTPYVTRGYLRAKITAAPALHRDQGTVDYAITVKPGDEYHMGKLEVKDLDAERTALFLKNWKLDPAAPYDASYVALFLKKNAKELHALDGYSASYKQYEHEDSHIVDLVVSFQKGGPLS